MAIQKSQKSSISVLLIEQALHSLICAAKAREKNKIADEVSLSINVFLLLGITVEGVINEIGEEFVDSWTWQELEKVSTPLKWRTISSLKTPFEPSKEPLQTITYLQKVRNLIAHPKSKELQYDILLISDSGIIKKDPEPDYTLPNEDSYVYIGFTKLIEGFNAYKAQLYMHRALEAIISIKKLFAIENSLEWADDILKQVKRITVNKNEFDK